MDIPARIHVLLAQKSPQAIVIRRGPSRQTAVIGWDRSDDSFTVGQWFMGKIYHYRSDLSPDGRYWIYFAMSAHGQTWTAVAKTPYLKALDFYPKGDAWNGGGLFSCNKSYWLNEGGPSGHHCDRHLSGLSVIHQWKDCSTMQGEYQLKTEKLPGDDSRRRLPLKSGELAVLIFAGKGNVPGKPRRRHKKISLLLRRKFHFSQNKPLIVPFKNIKLNCQISTLNRY